MRSSIISVRDVFIALPINLGSLMPYLVVFFHLYQGCQTYDTYLLTYLLTPCSRVLLEKLTGSAASQEIPRIFGTRRFLTVLTSARHLSLS